MNKSALEFYQSELDSIEKQGLLKRERIITSAQSAEIQLEDGRTVLNFCA
ncbi:MAG: glycine C-acetyltransferase, partial [Pseudomonadota bacterium]